MLQIGDYPRSVDRHSRSRGRSLKRIHRTPIDLYCLPCRNTQPQRHEVTSTFLSSSTVKRSWHSDKICCCVCFSIRANTEPCSIPNSLQKDFCFKWLKSTQHSYDSSLSMSNIRLIMLFDDILPKLIICDH